MPEALTDAQKVLRNDTGKRIAVALEALASEVDPSTVIAPGYDETQAYAVGDLVIYRSVLYRCTTAITTPEEWTAAHWTAVTVADELAEKYVKPTGGIPKNDLASAVQTSLEKADTALQQHQSLAAYRTAAAQDVIDANLMALGLTGASVGDLVRVAAVDANGKPTSWNHVPLCDIVTNDNLVDNGYFLNAVNQRGQGSYPNPGYCIDRWSKGTNGAINSIGPTYGLLVTPGTAIIQAFESGLKSSLNNKVCTLSVAITSGTFLTVYYGTFTYQSAPSATISVFSNSNMKGEIGTDGKLYITWQASFNYGIAAVKLELGSEQTLAHQENGVWVLNEIPDYGQELAKCQRYSYVIGSWGVCAIGFGQAYSDSVIYVMVSAPSTMAGQVSVQLEGNIFCRNANVYLASNTINEQPTVTERSVIHFGINVTGAIPGASYEVYLENNSKIIFSVN